jgi:endoglucanase
MKFLASAAILAPALLQGASATIYYAGVAESSGEFSVWSATSTKGTGLPGRFGVDYAFINNTAVDVMVDQNKVRTVFRLYVVDIDDPCPLP